MYPKCTGTHTNTNLQVDDSIGGQQIQTLHILAIAFTSIRSYMYNVIYNNDVATIPSSVRGASVSAYI